LRYISGTKLDERVIRADLDPGYLDGRQYGRGKSGGQVNRITQLHTSLKINQVKIRSTDDPSDNKRYAMNIGKITMSDEVGGDT
jgi:hypothetical protein